jgi:hypothetical protein
LQTSHINFCDQDAQGMQIFRKDSKIYICELHLA